MFGFFKKSNAANKVEFYTIKAYANGNVKTRRYYGDDAEAAAKRYASKNGAKAASIEAVNYYGNVVDFYYI